MRLGYVRISANTRNAEPELKMLDEASCDKVLVDSLNSVRHHISPACLARIEALGRGDELVVVQLDHLAPMPELLVLLYKLTDRGIGVVSLADDFSTKDQRVAEVFSVLGRYKIASARPKRATGRHPALDDVTIERARRMIVDESMSVAEAAQRIGVSRSTIYRNVPLSRVEKVSEKKTV
jgi:DNA invertase Pin-like site-specific DNA recombinase